MHELAPLIKDLAIMLGIASVVILTFQKLRQPVILGYIIAGVIVGPHTLPYSLVKDVVQIQTLAELGIIFLMFSLGLDFSFQKLKRIGGAAIIAGLLKVTIITAAGFWAGKWLGWSPYNCLLFGAAIAISSTTIIIKTLSELGLQGKRFTDMVYGILIVEDLIAILLLTSFSTVGTAEKILSVDMIFAVIKLILVIGSWFLSGYFIVPALFRKIIHYVNEEILTVVSIALCLFLASIAAYLHYSDALGAFIMGSILAETPFASRIKQLSNPLRDIFAAVFFMSIGMLLDLKILMNHWALFLSISLLTIFGKIIVTSLSTFLSGQSVKTAVRVGLTMPPVGEFSFILVGAGLALGMATDSIYQLIVALAAISTLVAPYLVRLSGVIAQKLETNMSERIHYILDSYSAWTYRALASYKNQVEYRKFVVRLLINGTIITLIFNFTYNFILPHLYRLTFNMTLVKILSWVIALLFSSPSIWGMLFSYKLINKKRRLPPLFLCSAITMVLLIVLSFSYCKTWVLPLIIATAGATIFALSYKQLDQSYHWLERHLIYVLRRKQQQQSQYEELAPWDTHLVEITVANEASSSIVGKPLIRSHLRQKFGVTIVAIRRGPKIILSPRGEETIAPCDKLIVLGEDDQIDSFKKMVENVALPSDHHILESFVLKGFVVEQNNSLVGQSIRESNIRELIHGFVVGLERSGSRILNPEPTTIIKSNDLLLLVGAEQAISAFFSAQNTLVKNT